MTGAYAQLNIQGPQSRAFMQHLVDGTLPNNVHTNKHMINTTNMSDAEFPFRAAKDMAIGLARVMVARITYVGELGVYESYILLISSYILIYVYRLRVTYTY